MSEYKIREDPEYFIMVIHDGPQVEYKIKEEPDGEWEVVFKMPGIKHDWSPWISHFGRNPHFTIESATLIVTRGVNHLLKSSSDPLFHNSSYALRHVPTGEIVPKEVFVDEVQQ